MAYSLFANRQTSDIDLKKTQMKVIYSNIFSPLIVALLMAGFFSCKNDPKTKQVSTPEEVEATTVFGNMKPVDLTDMGILLNIQAPENVVVRFLEEPKPLEKAVTVQDRKFSVIVDQFSDYADESGDASKVKEYRLSKSKERKDFSKVIYEDDSSYVFETNNEELGIDYHFFHVYFKDGIEYNFSDGFSVENYTQEEALGMLQSVRQD